MAFPNKAHQNDIRQSLPPITGIYPTMNMMLTGNTTNQILAHRANAYSLTKIFLELFFFSDYENISKI